MRMVRRPYWNEPFRRDKEVVMGSEDSRIVEVVLPNGAVALVRAVDVDGGGAIKTNFQDRFNVGELTETLEGWSTAIKAALSKASPDKVSVALGFEVALKSGKLTALLVEGQGKASLSVTMEWSGGAASG